MHYQQFCVHFGPSYLLFRRESTVVKVITHIAVRHQMVFIAFCLKKLHSKIFQMKTLDVIRPVYYTIGNI
jgi:hypothetical protein